MYDINIQLTAERIREKRKERGLFQADIAREIGVTRACINNYETGKVKDLSVSMICKIANVLGTSPAYLLGWRKR